jgi:hypothetical protein
MTVADGGDFTLRVRTNETRHDRPSFTNETGSTAIGQVTVDHAISDDQIQSVAFGFRVRKTYLESTVVSPTDVTLYRNETAGWRALQTRSTGENATHYFFTADSPGLSEFVIGVPSASVRVRDASLNRTSVTVGDAVQTTAVVENPGTRNVTHTLRLQVDGLAQATRTVVVPAGETRTVAFTHAFDTAGEYRVAVDGETAGTVTVAAAETQTSSGTATRTDRPTTESVETTAADELSTGLPDWTVVAVVALLGAAVAVLLWRRDSDGDDPEE